MCGDATNADDVRRVLAEAQPTLMVTQVPRALRSLRRAGRGQHHPAAADANEREWSSALCLFPGDTAYLWHEGTVGASVVAALDKAGLDIGAQIIWARDESVPNRGHYRCQHHAAYYAVRRGRKAHWRGGRIQSTLWQASTRFGGAGGENASGQHAPLEMRRRPMLNHTASGAAVYDPFLGSGATLMAAELCGRVCYGMEIDARAVDATLARWRRRTGHEPVLAEDGRGFDQVAVSRLGRTGSECEGTGASDREHSRATMKRRSKRGNTGEGPALPAPGGTGWCDSAEVGQLCAEKSPRHGKTTI
jgi:hypothetical protein